MDNNLTLYTAIAAGVMALIRILEFLIRKMFEAKVVISHEEQAKMIRKIYNQTNTLYDWHDKTDSNGRKSWYAHPDEIKHQEKVMEILNEISKTLYKSNVVQEAMIEMIKTIKF